MWPDLLGLWGHHGEAFMSLSEAESWLTSLQAAGTPVRNGHHGANVGAQ